jgi:hypothetical protein
MFDKKLYDIIENRIKSVGFYLEYIEDNSYGDLVEFNDLEDGCSTYVEIYTDKFNMCDLTTIFEEEKRDYIGTGLGKKTEERFMILYKAIETTISRKKKIKNYLLSDKN